MLRASFYLFFIAICTIFFSFNLLNKFEIEKNKTVLKYQIESKTTSLYIKESLKKYIQSKDREFLNSINNILNNNFNSLSVEKATFTITEKELISLANLNKKLQWELINLKIIGDYGELLVSTQSDDLIKELLTIEGSIPNEINKNIIPSSDIYTFIPNESFKNLDSLQIDFDAINQLDESMKSSAKISFDKKLKEFSSKNIDYKTPNWFKDLLNLSFPNERTRVLNSMQDDINYELEFNIEKIYNELYVDAKNLFFENLLWLFLVISTLVLIDFFISFLRRR